MATLTTEPLIALTAAPTDPASMVAVFSLPLLYLGVLIAARYRQRRRHDR